MSARAFRVFLALGAAGCALACGSAGTGEGATTTTTTTTTTPVTLADGQVESFDGVEIHYVVAGQGDPALVFVHCWSCDATYWSEQLEHFAPSHRVVAIDLAGHGPSGAGRTEWTIESYARDVQAVVEALDLRGAILIGHSMGGPVVVEAALRMPQRLRGVVGVDTMQNAEFRFPPGELEQFVAGMQADFPGFVSDFVRGMFPAGADPALVEHVASDMAAAPPAVAIPSIRNLFGYDLAAAFDRLGTLDLPLACISAPQPPTDVELNRRHAPQFGVVILPGVGHFLFLEQPAAFDAALQMLIDVMGTGPVIGGPV